MGGPITRVFLLHSKPSIASISRSVASMRMWSNSVALHFSFVGLKQKQSPARKTSVGLFLLLFFLSCICIEFWGPVRRRHPQAEIIIFLLPPPLSIPPTPPSRLHPSAHSNICSAEASKPPPHKRDATRRSRCDSPTGVSVHVFPCVRSAPNPPPTTTKTHFCGSAFVKIAPKPAQIEFWFLFLQAAAGAPTKSDGLRGPFDTAKIYSAAAMVVALAASGAD